MSVKKGLAAIRGDQPLNAWDIKKAIEVAYLARGVEKKRTKTSFSPSNLGYGKGSCPRYWYMAFEGAMFENTTDAEGHANMMNGIAAHERIQDKFRESTIEIIEIERELRVDDPPVFGFIDLIVKINGKEVVGEIKTARSTSWWAKAKKQKPQDYHLIQLLMYMHFSDIKDGFFYYENKDDLKALVIMVKYDDYKEYVLEIIEWMREVRLNWETGKDGENLPTRPYTQKSKACKSCPLITECWSGAEGNVDIKPLKMREP